MVSSGRHPKKPIAAAIKALDADLFTTEEVHKGHRWGVVTCNVCGDTVSVWSTPKVPENNAAAIARFAKTHTEKH
ncbi:hypothetical protein [Frigoribacterium sp. CFBP 13707]|uniref:hypothetical protein n=1 Tax=Frigoribacterium sp. CFBP 13707 TaxID=2775313 RepID=UPI00177DDDD7|nr:hypothetical protein [Frigoribacterium sp. CFBP 13707]MBD8729342.1 hypothetical protein [Frigoribacterium sp. CFBP 13707]